MPFPSKGARLKIAFAWAVLLAAPANLQVLAQENPAPADSKPELTLRFGIISYEDAPEQAARYRELFQALSKARGTAVRVQIAQGTYAEVLHWVNRGLVDLAVLSPGAYAEALAESEAHPDLKTCVYLASEGLPASKLPWAGDERLKEGYAFDYHALCLVPKDSMLRSFEDLKASIERSRCRLVFVDPLSMAGRIVPACALKKNGLNADPQQIEYSYAHSRSLELLASAEPPRDASGALMERAAFVFDGACSSTVAKPDEALRAIEVPALNDFAIPADVWVARADYPRADEFKSLLLNLRDAAGLEPFRDDHAHMAIRIKDLRAWMTEAGAGLDAPMTVEEIAGLLRHYARTHTAPPRLALVLSGGGAKCSYQVGAVSGLEEKLARIRGMNAGEEWMDFRVIVGTSGGAINALPIAMGIPSSPEGRQAFTEVWQALDLKKMVSPSQWVRYAIGLWLAGVYTVLWLLTGFLFRRARKNAPGRAWALPSAVLVGLLFALVLALPWMPTESFGRCRTLRYLGLYWGFGIPALFLFLPCFAAGVWFIRRSPEERRIKAGFVAWTFTVVLLVLIPGLTAALALFSEHTLFYGSGIERVLAEGFERLTRVKYPSLSVPANAPPSDRLRAVSRAIVQRRLVQRDLVITGNCLPPAAPSDRYFYLSGSASDGPEFSPAFGRHGVPLDLYPDLLLDVVMGSGTIYPIFPSRRLRDFPAAGMEADLIDGGFAHNSPIEAAVLWGATHIVLIEASPAQEAKGGGAHLLDSSLDAFNYLYDQAQLADVRSKERVTIFTLRPQPPHLYVLDFAPAHIRDAVEKGREDASKASFQRQPGEPRFIGE
ncbi:MAG: PhnD/SsuA/transferrin family substrate-binding protein [Planctomycetes bacterium]|nr:PhnD/SsuA/transferrin family substrate-binding protein [Planctomycetota bacterium]